MEIIGFWSPKHNKKFILSNTYSLNFDGFYSVAVLMKILGFCDVNSQGALQDPRSPKGPFNTSIIFISALASLLTPSQRYQLPSGTINKSLNNPPLKSPNFPCHGHTKNQKNSISNNNFSCENINQKIKLFKVSLKRFNR
jgi:hypothetical protein